MARASKKVENHWHRMIATVLVWPCNMNVPQMNSKAANGCSLEWQKAKRATQNLLVGLRKKFSLVASWNSTEKIVASSRNWDAWKSQLKLLPPQSKKDKQAKKNI